MKKPFSFPDRNVWMLKRPSRTWEFGSWDGEKVVNAIATVRRNPGDDSWAWAAFVIRPAAQFVTSGKADKFDLARQAAEKALCAT